LKSIDRQSRYAPAAIRFPGYCAERYVLHPGNADFTGDIKYLPLYMAPLLGNRKGSA
jgi:hypothetical protein